MLDEDGRGDGWKLTGLGGGRLHGEEEDRDQAEVEALHTHWHTDAGSFVSMLKRDAKCDVGRLMVRVEKEEISRLDPTL